MLPKQSSFDLGALLFMGVVFYVVLHYGLLPGFLAGLAAFSLTHKLSELSWLSRVSSKTVAVAAGLVILVPLLGLVLLGVEVSQYAGGAAKGYAALMDHLVQVIAQWRGKLPPALTAYIPLEKAEMHEWLTHAVQSQAAFFAGVGKSWMHGLLFVVVGIIVGALAAVSSRDGSSGRPLALAMRSRGGHLYDAFRQIVVAQFWIAFVNMVLTALFLFVLLPLIDVVLPYRGWLVLLTMVAGMLPLVGGVICNAVLTLVGLGVGPHIALMCLVFLITIHKLEYVISAKTLGPRISTPVWELLAVMFVLESVFGVAGLVAAPLYYAYLKLELKGLGWV